MQYHRWGNTPAMDVINLAYNEKDAMRDFSLAFVGLYSIQLISDVVHLRIYC